MRKCLLVLSFLSTSVFAAYCPHVSELVYDSGQQSWSVPQNSDWTVIKSPAIDAESYQIAAVRAERSSGANDYGFIIATPICEYEILEQGEKIALMYRTQTPVPSLRHGYWVVYDGSPGGQTWLTCSMSENINRCAIPQY